MLAKRALVSAAFLMALAASSSPAAGHTSVVAAQRTGATSELPANRLLSFTRNERLGHGLFGWSTFLMTPRGKNLTRMLSNGAAASWSPDGTRLAFERNDENGIPYIYLVDWDGTDMRQLVLGESPDWSPDGSELVYSRQCYEHPPCDTAGLYVIEADGTLNRRILEYGWTPQWSPEGNWIAFTHDVYERRQNNTDIYLTDPLGLEVQRLTERLTPDLHPTWSPRGRRVAYARIGANRTDYDIFVMDADGTNIRRLTFADSDQASPAWSPDGRKIAFTSDPVSDEVYRSIMVMESDGSNKQQVMATTYPTQIGRPTWQPCPQDQECPGPYRTHLSLEKDKQRSSISVRGALTPAHSGEEIIVKLYVQKEEDFRIFASHRVEMMSPNQGGSSRYETRFERPSRSICRIESRFRDDGDHLAAKRERTFDC